MDVPTQQPAEQRSPDSMRVLHEHTPRRDIQGLRALAVIAVVAFHAGLGVSGGFVGVDVFFVISGFVITSMLLREHARTGSIALKRFYSRRIRRLMPALALVVAVTLIITALVGSPFNNQQEMTALTGGGAMLAVANIVLALFSGGYFATPPTANPLLNTWSLSVEEQFYLVFPFVLLAALLATRALRFGRVWVFTTVAALSVASFLLSLVMSFDIWGYRFSDPMAIAFYSAPTRAWEFGVGALVALAAPRMRLRPLASIALAAVGLAGIVLSCFLINEDMVFPGWVACVPVAFTAMVIAGGLGEGGLASRVLGSRPLVAVGDRSYSWYLWHWPLIAFACILFPTWQFSALVGAVISVPVAWAAFRYVENPIRFDQRLQGRRLVALTALCLSITLILAGFIWVGARNTWWNAPMQQMSAQVSPAHAWITSGCDTATPLGARPPECTLHADGDGRPIYLLGDSQAGMLAEGLAEVADATDRPFLLGTLGGCPFIDATLIADGKANTDCADFVDRSTQWLDAQPPGTVVLGVWAAYMWLDGLGLQEPEGSPEFDESERMRIFGAALERTVLALTESGHEVVILNPIPGFPEGRPDWTFWYPFQCPTVAALVSIDNCGAQSSFADDRAVLEPYLRIYSDVALRAGAGALDLAPSLCPDGLCRTNSGNKWAYMDGQHISVGESGRLAPVLATAVS